ncbi:hypothetical protein DXG01_003529 [Tephrocybe rancida]|nr:hypothetical protein DXG01_003529 [Tephrocybe rancida]
MQKILLDNAGFTKGRFGDDLRSSSEYLGGTAVILSDAFTVDFTGEVVLQRRKTTYLFKGTSLSLFGEIPFAWPRDSTAYYVSVDGKERTSVTYDEPRFPAGPIYTSPLLADSNHNITFFGFPKALVDYATVGIGKDTPLLGTSLIVDEIDTSITYTGQWSRNASIISYNGSGSRLPVGNTTSQTNVSQSSATLHFSGGYSIQFAIAIALNCHKPLVGTSVSLVGVPPSSADVNITFNLDSHATSPSWANDPDPANSHFELFSATSLDSGDHILVMEFVHGSGVAIDYFIYTPSFSSLSASNGSVQGTASPSSATGDSHQTHRPSHTIVIGAVLGAIGGAVTLVLWLYLLARWKGRQTAKHRLADPYILPNAGHHEISTQHKSSLHGGIPVRATHTHYIVSATDTLNIESRSPIQRLGAIIFRRDAHRPTVEPFRGVSFSIQDSLSAPQQKPQVSDTLLAVARIQQESQEDEDAISIDATVVAPDNSQEGISRVEHLRQLMVEIQREIADSDA